MKQREDIEKGKPLNFELIHSMPAEHRSGAKEAGSSFYRHWGKEKGHVRRSRPD